MSRRSQLLIAAVAIAHAALFIVYQRPDWRTQWTDQNGYLILGRALAETGHFTRYPSASAYVPEAIRTPGYPALVAVVDRVFGESHAAIAWVQAVLFACICLLVYRVGRMAVGEGVGLAAGLATALYPPIPYYGALVLTEVLTTLLVTSGLALWIDALRRGRSAAFVASGIVFAAAALTRPSFQLLPVFLVAAALLTRDDRRRWWRGGVLMLAAFAMAVAPWLAYNAVYFHALTFSPAGGPGRQVFEGSWQVELPGRLEAELTAAADTAPDATTLDREVHAIADRWQMPAPPMLRYVHQHLDIERIWTEPQAPRARTQARIAADREYLRVGLDNIRRHPLRFLWRRLTRGAALFWVAEIPVRYSTINSLPTAAIRLMWIAQGVLILLAAAGGVVLARAGARAEVLAIAALVVYVSAVHVPMYSEARYSLPAKPMVLLLAVVAVAWMRGGGRGRRSAAR